MSVIVDASGIVTGSAIVTPGSTNLPGWTQSANEALVVCPIWIETGGSAGGVFIDTVEWGSGGPLAVPIAQVLASGCNTECWWIKATSGGTDDVVVTWGGDVSTVNAIIVVFSLLGRPTAFADVQTTTGLSTSPSVTITAVAASGLVVNVLGVSTLGIAETLTASETEIQQGTVGAPLQRIQGGASYVASTPGSVTTGWTLGPLAKPWGEIGVEFIDALLVDMIGRGVVPFPR